MHRRPSAWLTTEDFEALFTNFQRSAFRLETLSEYCVPQESDAFASFLAGQPSPPAPDPEWTAWVAQSTTAGKILERVHVVPSRLTPYLRFEIDWGYRQSARAGEDIFLYVDNNPASEFGDLPFCDFWIFDDTIVIALEYDHDGHFLHANRVAADKASSYIACRDRAKNMAVPLQEYLSLDRQSKR